MSDRAAPLTAKLEGSGPVALCLNGGMMSIASWDPIAAHYLAAGRSVLRCDFRGQLRTPGPPPPDFAGHVEDVLRTLDAEGIDRVDLVGASFGGQVALLLAARHPDRVRSLAAITVTDRADDDLRAGTARLRDACDTVLEGGDRASLYDLLLESVFSQAYLEASREELAARRAAIAGLPDAWYADLKQLAGALDDFDLRPELKSIRCRALVAIAGDDRVMPRAGSLAVADGISGARTAVWETAGHALVAERPAELARRCLELVEGVA